MKLLTEPLGSRHRLAWMVGAIALASCALLGLTARAHASETIYWDNYDGHSIGTANIDGSGARLLDLGETTISGTEGLAFDPANDRIYIANHSESEIDWVGINGGAGVLDTGSAPVSSPKGIAVDPATQTVYWGNGTGPKAIGYAAADESAVGGALSVEGASESNPQRIALDTSDGRIYWIGSGSGGVHVSYANLNNTGGGDLPVAEEELPEDYSGLSVDPPTGRLYILGEELEEVGPSMFKTLNFLYWINLSGVGGGEVDTTNAPFNESYGLAFDPSLGRFYWGNYESEPGEPDFGLATLAPGGGSSITISETEPDELTDGPQDPIVLKSPTGVAAPQVTGSGTTLSCSTGDWSQNYVGSYVYGAPERYGYQWAKDGQAIAGATGSTVIATASGSYSCSVTATNQFGSASQNSAGYTVSIAAPVSATVVPKPASFSLVLASKKKVKVEAGKIAALSLTLKNSGGTASSSSKVCAKLTKKAKKGLVAPKCVAVAALAPGASKVVTLRVKTKGTVKGTYKFSVVASGASGSTTLAERITITAKKKQGKHGKK